MARFSFTTSVVPVCMHIHLQYACLITVTLEMLMFLHANLHRCVPIFPFDHLLVHCFGDESIHVSGKTICSQGSSLLGSLPGTTYVICCTYLP
jgi:hypothetical protein